MDTVFCSDLLCHFYRNECADEYHHTMLLPAVSDRLCLITHMLLDARQCYYQRSLAHWLIVNPHDGI
jgi:hypothetical protein